MSKASDSVRAGAMSVYRNFLEENGEEVLHVASGTYSIPWAFGGEEGYVNVTFSIPKGPRGGAGYDGHEEARNFAFEQDTKAQAKLAKDQLKAKKIAKDTAARAKAKES